MRPLTEKTPDPFGRVDRMTSTSQHPAMLDQASLLAACETRRQRRGGPGGQHRNKVETAIMIIHSPTGIRGEASERRSQEQNRKAAIHRLRINLAVHHRVACSVEDYQPSDLWRQRLRNKRIAVSPRHEDFPAILAEALDVLAVCGWEPKVAASLLICSSSQLVKLLQLEPHALVELNRRRADHGLRAIR